MHTYTNKPRTYVVTSATGRSGSIVARGLLAAGHRVRAVGRDEARLAPLVEAGATAFVGNIESRAFIEGCFEGADAAYLVVSADHMAHDFRRAFTDIGSNFSAAARSTGLPAAVFLSTIGTHDDRHRGFIMTHRDVELVLNSIEPLNVLHLRAPSFFENLLYFLPASRARNALVSSIDPDSPLDMAANADVAALALRRLLALDFEGKSAVELRAPEPISLRRVAQLMTAELGRPVDAIHVDREADIEAMVSAGMHRDFSTLMNDTWDVFSRRGLLRASPPVAYEVTPTPLRQFLQERFIPLFRGVPAAQEAKRLLPVA